MCCIFSEHLFLVTPLGSCFCNYFTKTLILDVCQGSKYPYAEWVYWSSFPEVFWKKINLRKFLKIHSKTPVLEWCFQLYYIDLILTNQEHLLRNSNTYEVGISDHHHLVSIMLNKKISKGSTKTLFYRDYKKFEENKFARDLTHELQNIKNPSYSQFEKAFITVLDNHLPLKKKQLRFNHSPFMTKALRKAIMTRSRLKNI